MSLAINVALSLGFSLGSQSLAQVQASDRTCTSMKKATPAEALSALRQNIFSRSAVADKYCIDQAIERVRLEKPESTEPVLIGYLDFERPAVGAEYRMHVSPFPAVEVLAEHGKPALPALTGAIESSLSNPLTRENAALTIGLILHLNTLQMAEYLDKAGEESGPVTGRGFHEAALQMRDLNARGWERPRQPVFFPSLGTVDSAKRP